MTFEPKFRDFGPRGISFGVTATWTSGLPDQDRSSSLDAIRTKLKALPHSSTTLIIVRSLPYKAFALDPFSIANAIGFRGCRVLELGANCTTILDALEFATCYARHGERSTILCMDRFADVVANSTGVGKSGLDEWKNASSLIQIAPDDKLALARVSAIADPNMHDILAVRQIGDKDLLVYSEHTAAQFNKIDLENEISVIKSALGSISPDICQFVLTNRSAERTAALARALGVSHKRIHSSRDVIGHTGGTDIVFNLEQLLDANCSDNYIIISTNGLGYQWSSALIHRS